MPGEENTGTPAVTVNVAPAGGAPPAGEPAAAEPEKVTLTTAQLADRNARAVKSSMKKEFGFEDPAEVKSRLDKLAQYEKDAEAARAATLSNEQKLNEELAKEKAARLQAEADRDAAAFDAHTSKLYAELGIKNADYATFKLGQELAKFEGKPEGEKLDERAFLQGLVADKVERVALGLDATPPPPAVDNLPTTSPGNGAPPAPKPAGSPGAKKTAFDMTAAEWNAYKATNGL